jgi:hypothetical protein
MTANILSPLQLIAGASVLQNQGLEVSPQFVASVDQYNNTALISAFLEALSYDSSLATLAANSVPAFSNSVPTAYVSLGNQLTTVVLGQANADFANGDISKFVQALNLALSYTETTNVFINSAVNGQTYLGNTFTTFNDLITGGATSVNLATQTFGQDLINLGQLIDLDDLGNLGSPLALIQRLLTVTGQIPLLELIFVAEGVPEEIAINISNPTTSVSDSVQKLMYQAMTKISGDLLNQILQALGVTTVGIENMADLLNPVKLFPNSYQSLTTVTATGLRAVYIDDQGTVNSALDTELPAYVLSSVA